MTHTPNGDSGIGDFGMKGIQTFLRDHTCGEVCRALGLNDSVELRAPVVEQESEKSLSRQNSQSPVGSQVVPQS
ncbi:hypothetical protein B0H17DRAFT_1202867 [Mycena rosella]|uniref:Alpha-type protein kinase domain-containing protein n=1 Tax=Mycena rosella TaxID=1033263 RepID=A0AAD7GCZ2_MYCRO|nr:hypothetical protein B0H17DRAFT_1202867 [Mycena rosella]